MKVVLFCGGMGMRLRDHAEAIPKPLVRVGTRPLLMHLMRYYAHFGHKDFILCLGHQGEAIKEYFLHYEEALSNDFVLADRRIEVVGRDLDDWRITFVDTGLKSSVGERLRRVQSHLRGEEIFLANYADGLSDAPLDRMIDEFKAGDSVASFLSVPLPSSFHFVDFDTKTRGVRRIAEADPRTMRVNGGFFLFRQEIFNWLHAGEELVEAPFRRLIDRGKLNTYPYDGFWAAMDTFKDKQRLEDMVARGESPWEVWRV